MLLSRGAAEAAPVAASETAKVALVSKMDNACRITPPYSTNLMDKIKIVFFWNSNPHPSTSITKREFEDLGRRVHWANWEPAPHRLKLAGIFAAQKNLVGEFWGEDVDGRYKPRAKTQFFPRDHFMSEIGWSTGSWISAALCRTPRPSSFIFSCINSNI